MPTFDYAGYFDDIRRVENLVVGDEPITWIERYRAPDHPVDVLLYLGCNVLQTAHLAFEVVTAFQAAGVDFAVVGGPQFCCGIVHHAQGDADAARRLSGATVAKFHSYGARTVVMWCPSCNLQFEEIIRAQFELDFEITHASAFLAARAASLPFAHRVERRVVVHIHESHARQRADAVATVALLCAVPGIEVLGTLAIPGEAYHCSTALSNDRERFVPQRAAALSEAKRMGADALVTIYHSCQREWCEADTPELEICNYISLVAASLGCARPDRYKEFRKAGLIGPAPHARPNG
ncbi:MAG TPA: heterodisulfide reductase-related iron-sulfur binding cluster [Candidatus Lustribacter sp.]